MTAAVVGLAAAVLVLGLLVAGLLRSHAEILKALHELGAGLELDGRPVDVTVGGVVPPRATGSRTPEFLTGNTLGGETVALPLRGGPPTLLAFLSSSCTTCQGFWRTFAAGPVAVPAQARLVIVTRDLQEESESALRTLAPAELPVVHSSATWDALDVPGSPYFLLADQDGRVVGEGSAASWSAVTDLLAQAHADDQLHLAGNGRRHDARDTAVLRAAGVHPGSPSLYEAS